MSEEPNPAPNLDAKIDVNTPHAARIWNYWMGGKDNYASDRAAGDAVAKVYPDIVVMARQSRQFLIRAVTYLAADAGITQFLDIGTGLPTMQNTHEVAQSINPSSRIVYVDNDTLVLAHARALLRNTTPEGVTTYVNADLHDPELIVSDARNVLDFSKPIAVMFMGVLGYVATYEELRSIVDRVMSEMPSGSHLVVWDGTDTGEAVSEGADVLEESGAIPYNLRTLEEMTAIFDGLDLVEPGLAPIATWRAGENHENPIDAFGAIGRKP